MRRDLPDLEHYRFNGSYALKDVLQTSAFGTPAQAIAALTKFSHPRTVSQTNNRNLFRAIRLPNGGELDDNGKAIKRGHYADYEDGSRVMLDDNQSPTNAFVWANGSSLKGYSDIQFNHVWFGAKDVDLYTSLANLCITPAFLAKLTDTDKEIWVVGLRVLLASRLGRARAWLSSTSKTKMASGTPTNQQHS